MRLRDPRQALGRVLIAPWFRERPRVAAALAAVWILAGGIVGTAAPDQRVLSLVLLSLPVALLAVTFGPRGGLAGGGVGLAFAALWSLAARGAEVGASGWATAGTLLLLGGLLGAAVESLYATERRAAHAEEAQVRLEERLRRHAEAVAINDLMVQSVAVAKWALEAGNEERALEVLEQIGEAGQRLVSSLLRDTLPLPPSTSSAARPAPSAAPTGWAVRRPSASA